MAIFVLDMVVGAIMEMGVEAVWESAKRREAILSVLEKLGLDLNEPPAAFDGLYAYTLVEYGVGKPKDVLDLFRREVIKEAFRRAFEGRNRSIFDDEVEAFLDSDVGRESYRLDYDPSITFERSLTTTELELTLG